MSELVYSNGVPVAASADPRAIEAARRLLLPGWTVDGPLKIGARVVVREHMWDFRAWRGGIHRGTIESISEYNGKPLYNVRFDKGCERDEPDATFWTADFLREHLDEETP